ncbi:nitrate- and nitrite sensing domain-containing protein [Streptomyces sudanensis]|uniref:Signal transduction histidine-protein kinase/phosphatase MprB n=2 Tax=Streptomyces TaxID=1883 RepID=A0ABY4TC48_9ACTN|nr:MULTISPECIES: nitrate- and nitrite sensing domain-containing protein [Streptomyces]URN15016.1 nitrate- and nitrite sensing domain-containing protein [Streptomyces sudanensis]
MQKRSETPGDPHVPGGRRVRVRNRLMTGVALVGVTVIGAGAPGVLATSADLKESQNLVTLAELNRQAVTLAHSLADERDEITAHIAAGRGKAAEGGADGSGAGAGRAKPGTHSARVDRQIEEIRAAAPDDVRRALADVPSLRRTALAGDGTATAAHRAYTEVIDKLRALAARLADRTPARAAGGPGRAPAELGLAVEQASATRGFLLAALAVPEPGGTGRTVYDPVSGGYVTEEDPGAEAAARVRDELSAAAHRARVREQVSLADFEGAADAATRESLAATVTGPEVKAAEAYLGKLADGPQLTRAERRTDPERLSDALTARIEQMRGVESALATRQVERMERLRDDDVTALELRIALLGGCLLVAIGVSTAVARTLTRPLAVLRLGAARVAEAPESEEPIRFTGRNDEFAQVVRSLNTLHGKLLELGSRAARDGEREAAAELAARHAELRAETERLTAELERQRHGAHHTFVNLSLRTLGLVERQLTVIEKLEEREQDPEQLSTLFKLDHMATVMRRHSENLLILAGHEHAHAHQGPVPLVDVLRAAVSEIERYERVAIQSLPQRAYVAGFAADDISHLLAELLENATSFSPPEARVRLSGWSSDGGGVTLSVRDEGIGIPPARLADLNARLADPELAAEGEGLGLRVAALLAARHGVRVELRAEQDGGVTALVVLPQGLLPDAPAEVPPAMALAEGMPAVSLPGAAEADSTALLEGGEAGTAPETAGPAARRAGTGTGSGQEAAAGAGPEPAAPESGKPVPGKADPEGAPTEDTGSEDAAPGRTGAKGVRREAEDGPADPPAGHTGPAGADEPPATTTGPSAATEADAEPGLEPDTDGPAVHEATLQVRLPAPDGAQEHQRTADEGAGPEWGAGGGAGPERVTDKGLPKRTPRIVGTGTPRAERTGGVNAEELRRRLGGFHRGAKEGRRDAEAEITGAEEAVPGTGNTVEEAHR